MISVKKSHYHTDCFTDMMTGDAGQVCTLKTSFLSIRSVPVWWLQSLLRYLNKSV